MEERKKEKENEEDSSELSHIFTNITLFCMSLCVVALTVKFILWLF